MNKRVFLIVLAAAALIVALAGAAVVGGALAYFAVRGVPVQAALARQGAPDRQAGILIASVEPDSPAAKAGLVRGDILTQVNGQAVNQPADVRQALKDLKAGDSAELVVIHGDQTLNLSASLAEKDGQLFLGIVSCGDSFPFTDQGFRSATPVQIGALVTNVTADSPAAKAGLQAGDLISAVDGKDLSSDSNLGQLIHSYKPGDAISLRVTRSGQAEPLDIQATLGEDPNQAGQAYLGVTYRSAPVLPGGKFVPAPDEPLPFEPRQPGPFGQMPFHYPPIEGMPFYHNLPELPEDVNAAVIVTSVETGTAAEKAGLQVGDVITAIDDKAIEQPSALAAAVQSARPGDQVKLTVYRSGESSPLEVQVTLGEKPGEAGRAYLGISMAGFTRSSRLPNTQPRSTPNPSLFPSTDPGQEA